MKTGNLIGRIFGIALAALMVWVVVPLGTFGSANQLLARAAKTWYVYDSGADYPGADWIPIWRITNAASAPDVSRQLALECDNDASVNSWTRDSDGITRLSPTEKSNISEQSTLSVSGETVVVCLELLDIPSMLTFDRDFVPDNRVEYQWAVFIDVDNNPNTGTSNPPLTGTDLILAVLNCKFPGETPHDATLIEGTRHDTWVYDENAGDFEPAHEIDVTVDYASNTITMVASKAWGELSNLHENSRFCFKTEYCTPDVTFENDITAVSQGSALIDDPVGDVPYDFIDIIQGSFLTGSGPTETWNLPYGLDADPASVNIWTYPTDAVTVTLASVEDSMPAGLLIWHYAGPAEGWLFYKEGWGAVNTLEKLVPGKGYIGVVPAAGIWEIPQEPTLVDGIIIESLLVTADHCYLNAYSWGYKVGKKQEYHIECIVSDTGNELFYEWSCTYGELSGQGSLVTWIAPDAVTPVTITVTVSDIASNMVSESMLLDVVACSECTFGC